MSYFEFHCHSKFSDCGNAGIEAIIRKCSKSSINGIALTDHDTIEGALELKNQSPEWLNVIIGEEITTKSGEIIGLFLKERIAPGLSIPETVSKIKKQGGLVILPHPFDRLRSKISPEDIEKNIDYFDIIEVFNARCIFSGDNEKAKRYAKEKNKTIICGSDAHFLGEYGHTIISGLNLRSPQEFLESLEKAKFKIKQAPIFFHLIGKIRKTALKLFK